MSTQSARQRLESLQGTVDLLVLGSLIGGSQQRRGIAGAIRQTSEQELLVEHGALYPALEWLKDRGWVPAKRGRSKNNRNARFYSLRSAGRARRGKETARWRRPTTAIGRILEAEEG